MSDRLSATFSALADPTRRAILAALNEGEKTVSELVQLSHLTQPAISKHLKVLEAANLIDRTRVARTRPCSINSEPLMEVSDWIARYRKQWTDAFDAMDVIIADMKGSKADD